MTALQRLLPVTASAERKLTWTKPSLTLTTAKHTTVSNTR